MTETSETILDTREEGEGVEEEEEPAGKKLKLDQSASSAVPLTTASPVTIQSTAGAINLTISNGAINMKGSATTPPVVPDVIDSGDKAAVKVTTSDLTTPQSISADAPQNPGNTPVVNQANESQVVTTVTSTTCAPVMQIRITPGAIGQLPKALVISNTSVPLASVVPLCSEAPKPITAVEKSAEPTTSADSVTLTTPAPSTSSLAEVGPGGDASAMLKKDNVEEIKSEVQDDGLAGDFDPTSVMQWENGVGALPGSNLKFRLNEFGIMEVITDDVENTESANLDVKPIIPDPTLGGDTGSTEKAPDEICRCENCGVYGVVSDFCKSGRFCSQSCVGAFANKKSVLMKKQSSVEKHTLGFKKKKRRLMEMEGKRYQRLATKGYMDEEEDRKLLIGKKSKTFSWSNYLEDKNAIGAPPKFFKSPFPITKNGFKVGMKLEGIDPKHPSLYCVLSVAEVRGYRVRLHFDGYSECYDFWTNADSSYIFPVGWTEKNNKKLQPPKGFTTETFNWTSYLKLSKATSAAKHLFTNTQSTCVTPHGFRVGMKLEAVDKKNTALTCVATVVDVLGERILIHFDGWEDSYDYWCDPSSPYIHPVGWCQENAKVLSPPNDWKDVEGFTWEDYLAQSKTLAVAARAFKTRPPHSFEIGYKFEVVDKRNPILIRVATIVEIEPHRLKVHFDGWSDVYDYWVDDDSPDIHPPGWCAKTGHPLQPPISPSDLIVSQGQSGCPTPGCKGNGHIKGAKYIGHHSAFGCPYSQLNMNKESALQDRLGPGRAETIVESPKIIKQIELSNLSPEPKKCPTQGCDGSGHVTGKYTAHHRVSGCPLAEKNLLKLNNNGYGNEGLSNGYSDERPKVYVPTGSTRGRKKKSFYENREKQQKATELLYHGIHQSVFMSAMPPVAPAKDLPLCWEQHSKLLPGVHSIEQQEVAAWSIEQVAHFVRSLPGCHDHAKIFQDEQIDGEAFLLLTQTDIVKIMNVKLGPALKIYNSILMFKNNQET